MHESNEVFKAIAARISMAVRLLDEGDSVGAKAVLRRTLSILPTPDKRNIDAALVTVRKGQSHG